MASLFLSYRHADSQEVVGRMCDRLKSHFPAGAIFRDLDSIPLGKPFPEAIREAIANTQVALIVIGPKWAAITSANGRRRLEDPADFVRIEAEIALSSGILVVPVLVSGAPMPALEDMPISLQPLVYLQAIQIRPDPDFHRDMDRLIAKLSQLLVQTSPDGTGVTPSSQASGPHSHPPQHSTAGIRILFADESAFNRRFAASILEGEGHTCVVASSSEEVLAAVKSAPVDLILMQVQISGMDACQATALIRQNERNSGARIPIIGMTGDIERQKHCLAAGMDGCVSRPPSVPELHDAVKHFVGAIDWDVVLFNLNGDKALMVEMLNIFVTESPEILADIRDSISRNDVYAVQRSVHTLKGILKIIGARTATEIARRLQTIGRNADWTSAGEVYASLERALEIYKLAAMRLLVQQPR